MNIITVIREYKVNATMGRLFVDNWPMGFTLEDVARPNGVKIPGETCIPEGCYEARVTMSNRFKRETILLSSAGKDIIIRDGISFSGIRVHKGNSVEDTDGCILVGASSNGEDRIWDCSEVDERLINIVKNRSGNLFVFTSK